MKYRKLVNYLLVLSAVAIVAIMLRDFLVNRQGRNQENPYPYDLTELRKVDPDEILFDEVAVFPVNTNVPKGVAVWHDQIIVVAEDVVLRFDSAGQELARTVLPASPTCVAVSGFGDVWIGMKDHVAKFCMDGSLLARWEPFGERTVITSLAVAGNQIYVADAGNRVVYQCDRDGNIQQKIGLKDESKDVPGYVIPSPYFDVHTDQEGFLWAVNPGRHSFENYNPDGSLRTSWTKSSMKTEGFSGCCNPAQMAIRTDNSFITSEKGIPRIKLYDQHGQYMGIVAAPGQFDEDAPAPDVAVDDNGRVVALDFSRKQIRIFQQKKGNYE